MSGSYTLVPINTGETRKKDGGPWPSINPDWILEHRKVSETDMTETGQLQNKGSTPKLIETIRLKIQKAQPFLMKSSPWAWIAVSLMLGLIYFFNNSSALYDLTPELRYYFLIPLLWTLIGLCAAWGLMSIREKPTFNKLMLQLGTGAGLMQIAGLMIAGLIFGFGNSPYTHQFPAILGNLFYVVTYIGGAEFARAYLFQRLDKKRPMLTLSGITLLFTLFTIPIIVFTRLNNAETIFVTTGKIILPEFAENILATYLVMVGGPWTSIIYRLIVALFEWGMPILPKLSWLATAFIGTVIPAIMLMLINQVLNKPETAQENAEGKRPAKKNGSLAWIIVAIVTMLLLWFNLGLFGVQPFLVSGVSMQPTLYAGDIVIVKNVAPEEIAVGDVILYKLSNGMVLHRVIEIQNENGQIQFITQGDGLNIVDNPVGESQLKGKMIASIPKLGWISIGVRRVLGWDQ